MAFDATFQAFQALSDRSKKVKTSFWNLNKTLNNHILEQYYVFKWTCEKWKTDTLCIAKSVIALTRLRKAEGTFTPDAVVPARARRTAPHRNAIRCIPSMPFKMASTVLGRQFSMSLID